MAVKAKAEITIFYVNEVEAVYRYYLLQSSTLGKPSVPTSYPPSSSWVTTEPTYTEGSTTSLYYTDCTVLTDGTWSYSPVSLSSSYEAAKLAYNKALAAEGRVTEVEADIEVMNGEISLKASKTEVTTAINEIQIGGRNLLRHTSQMPITDGYYYDTNGIGTFGLGTLEDTGEGIKLTFDENGRGSMAVPLVSEGAVNNGDTVTLSFDYRGDLVHFGTFYYIQKTEPNVSVTGFPAVNASTTEWKHYQHTFSSATANDRINYTTLLFYNPGTDHANTWIEVKKDSLKLELGNKATDWTPAPEDQQAVVDTVAGNLNASIGDIQTSLDSTNSNLSDLEHDYNATYEIVTENSTKISELLQTAEGWTMSFETLNTTVTELNGKLTSEVNERYEYIRFEDGDIYLGKRPEAGEDDLQLIISNEKISFNLNGTEVAYFSDDALYVTTVHVTKALRFGNFEFAERENGNMGLRWVGES